jgi:alkylated DNA nucleotide flippase Atl1
VEMTAMTEAMKEAVVKAVRENPDKTYGEIAQLHGVPMAQVSVWARQAGIRRKATRGEGRIRGLGKLWNANEDSLENLVREKEAELARLKQELASQTIRFEREGEIIAVHGISRHIPFRAHYKEWLRFLRKQGPSQLRELIASAFGHNGNGGAQ